MADESEKEVAAVGSYWEKTYKYSGTSCGGPSSFKIVDKDLYAVVQREHWGVVENYWKTMR